MNQVRNQGGQKGRSPLRTFFAPPLEKCVGHSLKLLDIVQKIWAPSENSSPLLVPQAGHRPGVNTRNIFEEIVKDFGQRTVT